MKRREFITLLGAAAVSPLAARAQQPERTRRIGIHLGAFATDDPDAQARLTALVRGLQDLGWAEGRNLRIDLRTGGSDLNRINATAAELVQLAPDVLVVTSTPATRALQRQTQTTPIVFVGAGDPVSSGMLGNIARPEGNVTGFSNFEPSLGGKWLALLKEAAPHVTRVALIFDPDLYTENSFAPIEESAPRLGVQAIKTPVHDSFDVVRALDAFATEPNGGLIVLPSNLDHLRETIFRVAVQHRLPGMYTATYFATEGGLMAYSYNVRDMWRRAAAYVDSLLRGAKVADLPVQFPTKFELVINLKTAKAMGLTIPDTLLLRTDTLIE
jgi:putative ABC transport system substrate-binding protein